MEMNRRNAKVLLAELATQMGRSIGWLSQLENDKVELTPEIVREYIEALEKLKENNEHG